MRNDWYPPSRDGQIHMVEAWLIILAVKAALWGIPQAIITALTAALTAAKEKLAIVKSGERTAVSVVECNEVFKELETEARYIKKHYFLVPPLTLADLVSLLLPLPDETPSPIGEPAGQPVISVTYPGGPHLLKLHLGPLAGTEPPDSRGDYGFAVYKGVMPHGGATLEQAAGVKHYLMKAPLDGEELLHYRFTRRKTEVIGFAAGEAGMTAYFCSRYENGKGEEGKWGPVASAIIP